MRATCICTFIKSQWKHGRRQHPVQTNFLLNHTFIDCIEYKSNFFFLFAKFEVFESGNIKKIWTLNLEMNFEKKRKWFQKESRRKLAYFWRQWEKKTCLKILFHAPINLNICRFRQNKNKYYQVNLSYVRSLTLSRKVFMFFLFLLSFTWIYC